MEKGEKAQSWMVARWMSPEGGWELLYVTHTEEEALATCQHESYVIIPISYYTVVKGDNNGKENNQETSK